MTPYSRILSGFFGAVFSLMAVSNSFAMTARQFMIQTYHGIPYVSGGVCEEDRQSLRQMTKEDNLQLIFAAKDRDYLSDVTVRIADDKGREVLNTVTQGSWLFTNLPTGKYTIKATLRGHSQGAITEVSPKGQTHVYLTWENAIEHPVLQSVMHR